MKNGLHYILLYMMSLLALTGCDVHEFPEERGEGVDFLLHLNFDASEMPLHEEIPYTRSGEGETKASIEHHDIRYIINAYRIDNVRGENRIPDTTFIFTKAEITSLDYTARLELPEGSYNFIVWADFVSANSTSDKYYDTHDFAEIILADPNNHPGSNPYREAYRGYATATVKNPDYYSGSIVNTIDNQATAEMKRPMGKFKFISTDVDIFLNRIVQAMKEKGLLKDVESEAENTAAYEQLLQSIDWSEYTIVFKYDIFMPCSFNMFADRPADVWNGTTFSSRMTLESDFEMSLGYDYVFVNGSETTLSISLAVYNKEGELMSSANNIDVPIVRNKTTLVTGEFLTSKATGGISINPGYDGKDYNIEIK